ncbi:MAG: hydrogenase formation protein HypD [Burkholderiales bacterium]|nr:hydrogenase formation protein HypD [Burkholderiales bacterium]
MKHADEYRDPALALLLADKIARAAYARPQYRLMEFCGGHTHAISRYGIADLLPANVNMIHGPGCPVCVLPIGRIDNAIELVLQHPLTLCTYADTLRVPASDRLSLMQAKARGADVRMVYSAADALRLAQEDPAREIVFFAIGFETTAPSTALAIRAADRLRLPNFSVFCNHVLTPPAMSAILGSTQAQGSGGAGIDGVVGPGHVSCVIGSRAYEPVAEEYCRPVVIAGFEPLDLMQTVLMLIHQINRNRHEVENEYTRAVTREGNAMAQELMEEVFVLRDSFEWRGLGEIADSAYGIRQKYARFDAERRYGIARRRASDNKACECGAILRGEKKPADCRVFGTACTPDNPLGACMVSSEGACAAHYSYGRFRASAAAQTAGLAL